LHSITIETNPIRGFDWRGLIERDEVIKDKFVRRFDGDENEIIDVVDEEKKDEIVIAAEDTGEGMTKSEEPALEYVDDDDEFLNAVNSVVENESKDDKTSHVSFRYECVSMSRFFHEAVFFMKPFFS